MEDGWLGGVAVREREGAMDGGAEFLVDFLCAHTRGGEAPKTLQKGPRATSRGVES